MKIIKIFILIRFRIIISLLTLPPQQTDGPVEKAGLELQTLYINTAMLLITPTKAPSLSH